MEERLEDACVDVARRVGVDVDTDQNVHPFEVAFTIGQHLRVDALPGMQIPEEPVTMLGSFWRETAVARDELQWFATGNRLVEALVGLVRDGEVGRTAVFRSGAAPRRGALHTRWHLVWPSPADLSPGSRVPSRQASRYLDGAPIEVAVDLGEANRLVPAVVAALRPDEEPPEARVGPVPRMMIDAAHRASEEAARELLSARRDAAVEKLQEHANAEEERLVVAAFQRGATRQAVDAALAALRAHRAATEDALRQVRLELDAAAVVLPS
jgi:ATP-dependent helicase HepA